MQKINTTDLQNWYSSNKVTSLHGLRILFTDIEDLIEYCSFKKNLIGYSENGLPVYKITIGNGSKKVLMWSQMHGNESTGTKAIFDLISFFNNPDKFRDLANSILKNCTIEIIPMLNPDGAITYTRVNANNIDLNRDAVDRKAKESNLLRKTLDAFKPEFCFNLHDQRTIFNVGETNKPATLSFLAPSEEVSRAITKGRTETMSVIVAMNDFMQKLIPGQIGRYTDEFYPTATGDNFQKLGYNTILVEAGHFKDDYDREETRKFNFFAILEGLNFLANTDNYSNFESYFEIPNNSKMFFDIIYRNVSIDKDGEKMVTDLGILFKYKVVNNKLERYEHVEKQGDLSGYFAHCEIDLAKKYYNQ